MKTKRNIVGSVIRKKRTERNWTQEALSKKCKDFGYKISRSTLAKIEAEIRRLTEIELYTLSKVLKLRMEELFPANPLKVHRKVNTGKR